MTGAWLAAMMAARAAARAARQFAAEAVEQAYEDEVSHRPHAVDRTYRWPHERGQSKERDA